MKSRIDNIKFSELLKLTKSCSEDDTGEKLNIFFIRNITLDNMIPYLIFIGKENGFSINIDMGEYDNAMQTVMDTDNSIYSSEKGIIIIAIALENLSNALVYGFSELSEQDIVREKERVLSFVEALISNIRKNSNSVLLLHNFPTPVFPAYGILDSQKKNMQLNTVRSINLLLLEVIEKFENVFLVDVDRIQSLIGYERFYDKRYWHIAKAPYSLEALKNLAKEYFLFIGAMKRSPKKCLVLDCDNTLWGGILGEDGFDGIKIGNDYPGSAFREFQKSVLNLYNKGIMLAINSKNNEQDVMKVLEEHPDMILRKEHFLVFKINWQDKAENIKEIARELNIGLDSILFIDDSQYEIEAVSRLIPDVECVLLPKDPVLYRDILDFYRGFDVLSISVEDRKRNMMYKAGIKRKNTEASFENMEEYLRYLEMEVEIGFADDFSVSRIAQLTQRTNQFNLTTIRYSESDIKEFMKKDDCDVFFIRARDRFGEIGIVGVAILKYIDGLCIVDSFILSCRAIGRGIEKVMLLFCIEKSFKKGAVEIRGRFSRTAKNVLVSEFYDQNGFDVIEKKENEKIYAYNSGNTKIRFPEYFKSVVVPEDK